jgi:imidazolonepropionase
MKIYQHISHLFTMQPMHDQSLKNANSLEDCGYVSDATVCVDDAHTVMWAGASSSQPQFKKDAEFINCRGETWLPGLIDCHTHLVFAGQRSAEMIQKRVGVSYLDIAKSGGGIQSTVKATREATESKLLSLAEARVATAKALGVRHLEIKSGYGLNTETELKMLKITQSLQRSFQGQMSFTSTFLGAHAIPKESNGDDYTTQICEEMLPKVVDQKLASFCDVFIEEGFFTLKQGERILKRAKDLGLYLRAHVDECTSMGGVELACELGAVSVDHGIKLTESGIQALKNSSTALVLLPLTSFTLQEGYAPGRKCVDNGIRIAIATDFNPGSSPSQNIWLAAQLGMIHYKLSPFEVLGALTVNAAHACGESDRLGIIGEGRPASFARMRYADWQELFYWIAQPVPVIHA